MNETLAPIEELLRVPTPRPAPMGIAYDGTWLWLGSYETHRLYGFDPRRGSVFEEAKAPGQLYGLTVLGDELRAVVGEGEAGDDDRSIARYVIGHGFKTEMLPCPDRTGSFLAYDGDFLFLSQRFLKRIVELDSAGAVRRLIPVPRETTGMTILDGRFYVVTTESRDVDDLRLLRLDARKEPVEVVELASIGFGARGLAYDGTRFWTCDRAANTIVAFARPDL